MKTAKLLLAIPLETIPLLLAMIAAAAAVVMAAGCCSAAVVAAAASHTGPLSHQAAKDEVYHLPGFDGPLPSRLFSGYIPIADNTRHMHYWFVESEGDPAKDPVILWMQGGPGASSAIGMFTELGPYSLSDESFANANSSVPTLKLNPYSWTKVGSLIFIESPCGVGFSYCDSGECPSYNDTTAADDNLEFVKGFFERFEQLRLNDFYITGESYGGIFVPMLAERVSERPDLFNLKGIAVGNGCVGIGTEGGCGIDEAFWILNMLHGHGQYSTETYESLMSNCETSLRDGTWRSGDPLCQSFVDKAIKETGTINAYQIYDECNGRNDMALHDMSLRRLIWRREKERNSNSTATAATRGTRRMLEALNDYPCGSERALASWLDLPEVKAAFHVSTDIDWQLEADREADFHYNSTKQRVQEIYKSLIDGDFRGPSARVLIYFGDVDARVPANGGEYWVRNLGLKVQEPWRPWTLDWKTQVAGHIVRYEKGFDFVTIRGAGHMVPRYKPEAALAMFTQFVMNLSYPTNYPLPHYNDLMSLQKQQRMRGEDVMESSSSWTSPLNAVDEEAQQTVDIIVSRRKSKQSLLRGDDGAAAPEVVLVS